MPLVRVKTNDPMFKRFIVSIQVKSNLTVKEIAESIGISANALHMKMRKNDPDRRDIYALCFLYRQDKDVNYAKKLYSKIQEENLNG